MSASPWRAWGLTFPTILMGQLLHPSDADAIEDRRLPAAHRSHKDLPADEAHLRIVQLRHDDGTIVAK